MPSFVHLHRLPSFCPAMGCLVILVLMTLVSCRPKSENIRPLQPLTMEAPAPELALLMGELQRLTHKMALAGEAGNADLAAFYMHESLEQLRKIQAEVPEYEGQPIALLIDRLGLPAYSAMQEAVMTKERSQLLSALDVVLQSCNACHSATLHPFIRITRGTEINPYNQSFQP